MLAFQHTWKGLLLLACLYTCSGAPLSCDPEGSAACFSSFSQGILRVALPHLTQNISVQNANLSFVSQICSEYNRTYLPCISPTLVGCPAWSYITYEMTSAAVEYICRSNETMVRDVLACVSVPSVAPAIMACNEAALAATKPCHPAYTWQRCVADITSNVCSVSSNAALNDVIAHSLQPMFDLYPCQDNYTSVTSEPEPEITRETGTPEPEPEITRETGTPEPGPEITRETEPEPEVTSAPSAVCDLMSFSMCSAELNQDLQVWVANLIVSGRFNDSDLDTLCRVHYRKYQQCVWPLTSGCRKDTMLVRDIMVAAFDFICSADIEDLRSTIPCISQPGFTQELRTCALASSTSGMCSFATNYKTCVSNVTSGCTDPAQQVISDLVDNLLKPLEEIFPCDVDVTTVVSTLFTSTTPKTPVTSTFKTTTYITPTPEVVTGGVVIGEGTCGRKCQELLNVPLSRVATASLAGNFTLTIYTDACPIFDSFRECMASLSEPCVIPALQYGIVSQFEFACGKAYSAIIEYEDCWERDDIQASWNSCITEFTTGISNGTQNGICRHLDAFSICIREKVATCGQVPLAIVTDYINASTYSVRRLSNCSLGQPTTGQTTTTTATTTTTTAVPTSSSSSTTTTTSATTTPTSTTTSAAPNSTTSSQQNQTVTIPKLPITCFDCNSGTKSWPNPQCTIDGHIEEDLVGKTTCMDRCFAKTNKWNKGVIFRGCAAGFWMPEARPLPRSGCQMIRDEMWCFCDHDNCNEMSMARFV
ncbi:mucin-5AC-like isoform X2 [Haliotis rubra]|uniref:mucin-5AC-like isoform X2 n=1 Tax=Haliotis rubra TaxID=36100 RepID=UPI001EE59AD7|nr:mucin-5AC-like isoform X2 [Haliotis rubra]